LIVAAQSSLIDEEDGVGSWCDLHNSSRTTRKIVNVAQSVDSRLTLALSGVPRINSQNVPNHPESGKVKTAPDAETCSALRYRTLSNRGYLQSSNPPARPSLRPGLRIFIAVAGHLGAWSCPVESTTCGPGEIGIRCLRKYLEVRPRLKQTSTNGGTPLPARDPHPQGQD
jgi:hypothetical protein